MDIPEPLCSPVPSRCLLNVCFAPNNMVTPERVTREESDRFVVPILLLEPIPPDLGPYLRLDYYWQIIDALKDHLLVKELVGNVAPLMATPEAARKTGRN